MVTYSPSWQRNLRVVLCILLPPLLGTYALVVPSILQGRHNDHFSWLAVLWGPLIYSVFAYLRMGIQSVVYALLIELWLRRSNPRQSSRSYLAFVGYSAALGGIAGLSSVTWDGPSDLTALLFFFGLGAGIGVLMALIVCRWLVHPQSEQVG